MSRHAFASTACGTRPVTLARGTEKTLQDKSGPTRLVYVGPNARFKRRFLFNVCCRCLTTGLLRSGLGLTTGLLGTAAVVVGQADDHLPCSTAHGQSHSRAVVLHGLDGIVVTAVHAAAIFRRLPKLAVGMGNTGAVCAC